jgi:hypothetical protein
VSHGGVVVHHLLRTLCHVLALVVDRLPNAFDCVHDAFARALERVLC